MHPAAMWIAFVILVATCSGAPSRAHNNTTDQQQQNTLLTSAPTTAGPVLQAFAERVAPIVQELVFSGAQGGYYQGFHLINLL